ncbi:biopolymer transporter ExbD [Myxococcota bacterium]|nr:biopolymer transporter ExbD [Myxococcota bacterium]MBU1432559.1 biopolymer transporter ExbD [Myxococcota bacterium]MBU1898559.1 biopolymer transporter ExbD [Myxococcota bacterium]
MNFRAPRSALSRRAGAVVDMTALVDVIFQLLIFFLLTSSYVRQQSPQSARVQVDLPESSLEAQPEQFEDLSVSVDAEGQIFMGDEALASFDELVARLEAAAARQPNTILLLRGDKAAAYGRVADIIHAAQRLKLKVSMISKTQ